jgi:ABC-type multidrug transport system ATPase subunit
VIVTDPVITARGLGKSFGNGFVLDDVDLTIYENETTLLMGPNGSGKTVLLSCLAGGLYPSEGTISVFGDPPDAVRDEMNFMLQGGMAIPELTGRANLSFYTDLHPRATDDWQAIVERVDLADDLDREVRDYSEGMVRKLELAITLSVDASLYLLDEPTVDLDLTTVDRLHSLLSEQIERGKTVVMTSHAPRDIEVADRVLFVSRGEVVTEGTPGAFRAAVPTIVSVDRLKTSRQLSEHVLAGQFFEDENALRGFVPDGTDLAELAAAANGDVSFVEEPGYSDVFNYYTQVAPVEASETDD